MHGARESSGARPSHLAGAALGVLAALLPSLARADCTDASADDCTKPGAPVLFGLGLDFGVAGLAHSGASTSPLYDQALSFGVSGGHFGAWVAGRFGIGDWLFGEAEILGRYYLFDAHASPFLSAGFVPWLAAIPSNAPSGYQATSGQGAAFELGEEVLRADAKLGLRLKVRADVPFYSLRDAGGALRSFWIGSFGIELVARKVPDHFWML
ncbi:MAG TPA: hypothetical protein VGG39_37330 [Polyangiaceae bacterium]